MATEVLGGGFGPKLQLHDVTVRAPGQAGVERPPLVEGLDFSVPARGSVLIMGPSGRATKILSAKT